MIMHYIEQGTEDWLQLKLGKMSGSDAGVFLVNGKGNDGWGASVQTYIYKKVAERITGESEYFKPNFAMERGTMLEPNAILEYESQTWNKVTRVGFVEMNEYVGCSPDGLVGSDGMIEVKCPMQTEFVRFADTLEVQKDHFAQMQFNMFVCKRNWCDYVVYHPDFNNCLIIEHIKADQEVFSRFEKAAQYFEDQSKRLIAML